MFFFYFFSPRVLLLKFLFLFKVFRVKGLALWVIQPCSRLYKSL